MIDQKTPDRQPVPVRLYDTPDLLAGFEIIVADYVATRRRVRALPRRDAERCLQKTRARYTRLLRECLSTAAWLDGEIAG